MLAECVPKLLGTPAITLVQGQHVVHQLGLAGPTRMMGRPAAILQALDAFQLIARQPLVADVPADAEGRANPGHHCPFFPRHQYKTHPLFHAAGLSPRHRQTLLPSIENLSAMYPVQTVSYVSGPYPLLTSPPSGGEEYEVRYGSKEEIPNGNHRFTGPRL